MKQQQKQEGQQRELPRSVQIAEHGIVTSGQFCNLMSALMSDLLLGKVTPQVGNAVVNAGGKLLKTVELEQKYGTEGDGNTKTLRLAQEPPKQIASV